MPTNWPTAPHVCRFFLYWFCAIKIVLVLQQNLNCKLKNSNIFCLHIIRLYWHWPSTTCCQCNVALQQIDPNYKCKLIQSCQHLVKVLWHWQHTSVGHWLLTGENKDKYAAFTTSALHSKSIGGYILLSTPLIKVSNRLLTSCISLFKDDLGVLPVTHQFTSLLFPSRGRVLSCARQLDDYLSVYSFYIFLLFPYPITH